MVKRREKKTVLVVEDEVDIRNFTARVLELEGYHVLQAENGIEGLRLAKESGVALVLLDLRLPGLNGWELLERLKADPQLSEIPVVVLTSSADALLRERALSLGATDYLIKPLSAASLKEAVGRALRGDS